MPSTAIIWGVIAKVANKMADLSPLFNSLYFLISAVEVKFLNANCSGGGVTTNSGD